MIDLEALERALTQVEKVLELFEELRQPGKVMLAFLQPVHDQLEEEIKEGLWERFLEARESRPTAAAWKIRVRLEEA